MEDVDKGKRTFLKAMGVLAAGSIILVKLSRINQYKVDYVRIVIKLR